MLRSVRIDDQNSDLRDGRVCHRCAALAKLGGFELEINNAGQL